MSRYGQPPNYYDPVGSQSYQPTGYTYQPANSSSTSFPNSTASAGYQYGGTAYNNTQQYGANTGQHSNSSASHAAAALSSMSNQPYSSSANRSGGSDQYNQPPAWQSSNSNTYGNTQQSSTFARPNLPDQSQSQRSSNTFARPSAYQSAQTNPPSQPYPTAHGQQQQQKQNQPPRYNSPNQAMQAQRQTTQVNSWSSNNFQPSPQMPPATQQHAAPRQQSASVDSTLPPPTTVNPSQVYDNRAELQRKAQIEAEKRRRYEAEQAEKKRQHEAEQAEHAAKTAEEERVEAERRKAEEEARRIEEKEAKQKAAAQKKVEQRKKAREDKRMSSGTANAAPAQSPAPPEQGSAPQETDEEAQMRAMFQKMREFNAKNPAMLARLWEEERRTHAQAQSQSPQPASVSPALQKVTAPAAAPASRGSAPPPASSNPPAVVPQAVAAVTPQQPQVQPPTIVNTAPVVPPANPQTATTLWPPHKKGAIANAAASWLRTQPQNANSTITTDSVQQLLDRNPSYVQLCEALEAMGLRFERTALARELLKAVPEGGSKTQPTVRTAATPVGASSSAMSPPVQHGGVHTVAYTTPLSLAEAAKASVDSPAFSPARSHRAASQSQPPEVKPELKPAETPRPPANKEEAARKRTFGDLVDLTAEDSDDEPPAKKLSLATGNHINGIVAQHRPSGSYSGPLVLSPGGKTLVFQGPNALSQPILPSNTTPPPPPQPVQPVKPKGPTLEQQQLSRLRGKMLVEPIMRDRVARKSRYDSRTIARDVLLATGRHPDMRGLNAHLATMQKLLGQHGGDMHGGDGLGGGLGNRSDLATIKWDVIDPEVEEEQEDATHRDASPEEMSRKHRPAKPHPGSNIPLVYDPGTDPTLTHPRLGADSSSTSNNAPRPSKSHHTSRSASATSTPAATNGEMPPVGYSAFRRFAEDGTEIKKKGRPFGWKKSIHSREAQGLPSKGVASLPSRKKTATSTPTAGTAKKEDVVLQPVYQVYKCRWNKCKTELHNLETLKKHIIKVHGLAREGDERFECWWKGCGAEKRAEGRVLSFDGIEDWLAHVDEEHLAAVRWKLGDGPKAGE